ncbi:MAG: protein translocase subunit SecF [Syntrophobacteraceae bacterium]
MELLKPDLNINFVGYRNKAVLISLLVLLVGLVAGFLRGGLNMGVDFAGGTLIQVKFNKQTNPDEIRNSLKDIFPTSFIQQIGAQSENEYLIRTEAIQEELASLSTRVEQELTKDYGAGQDVRRVEMVGPKVGQDLRQKALYAIFYALLLTAIYISWRFEFRLVNSIIMGAVMIVLVYLLEATGMNPVYLIIGAFIATIVLCWFLKLPYAIGALISILHDIGIAVAFFAIFNKEFSLEVLAALLTLAGYSLNDTIVIYDRIRENRGKDKKLGFAEMINRAINQTLSRTILTVLTVFFVVLCLFLFGGTVIHDFSFALLIGLIAGSYSTIYIASPFLIFYEDVTGKKKPSQAKRAAAARSK